jgi:NAD(P)-dependent dehydrogenase (short-subunit alcohol dehydrogenase family)
MVGRNIRRRFPAGAHREEPRMTDFPTPYTIAIVGAASGIGRATAALMASRGATLVCHDRDGKGAAETAASIIAAGGKASAHEIEITDRASQKSVWDAVLREAGQLHALVNCAGVTGKTNLKAHEVDPDDFEFVYRVNMLGPLLVSQAVLPHMLERGYGRILHLASIAGKDGNAGMTAYSATKAGVIGMVKSMGKDYAETGVTINALAPAVIRTPMVAALPDAQVKYMTDRIPMKRCGELDEAAEMISFIVSPACSFTTGFTFDLTGGRAVY